ncbi:hypothetical protein GNZ13_30240 [Paraburkholderia sp. 5N]|uniref:Uncharacterized protein n=1 Tax=Paraburkholderia elongata TaxID=2675747 RepID=A0A972SL42_9BURK|nr:hypothetical protein [Paraburkholderia elongata]
MNLPEWVEEIAHFPGVQQRIWLRRRLAMFGVPVGFILHDRSSLTGLVAGDPGFRMPPGTAGYREPRKQQDSPADT